MRTVVAVKIVEYTEKDAEEVFGEAKFLAKGEKINKVHDVTDLATIVISKRSISLAKLSLIVLSILKSLKSLSLR